MNEIEARLTANLADITAEHQKLISAHVILRNEMHELRAAIKSMTHDLADSANIMVDLSYDAVRTSLNLNSLLTAIDAPLAIDVPSTADIATARIAAIEAAQTVAVTANTVSDAARDMLAYMRTARFPGAMQSTGPAV